MGANSLASLKTCMPLKIIPLVLTRKPRIPPSSAPITPPFYFQPIPQISIGPQIIALSTSYTQDLDLVMSN